ncbi:MAG: S8 family serine peptidase, partial [Oceanicaulis sp.]|nr:S8 family serine peptidase [Oceanicaulis sp.]
MAVIDTGINTSHPEFIGRIDPASTDIVVSRGNFEDIDGHGTAVAGVIAANRDGVQMHGLAFESQVMAIRTDSPGTCEDDDPDDGGCRFSDTNIAAAIDYAIANGARVINISLGAAPAENDNLTLTFAALRRAAQAGVFLVIAAGNDGEEEDGSGDSPAFPANFAATADAMGFAVAVGSIDLDYNRSSFSNRAGGMGDFYLLAPGRGIFAPYLNSPTGEPQYAHFNGTSLSAPFVAGALALLLQAFPHLQGNEALQILFETADLLVLNNHSADDGRGLINLYAAFQPVGNSSVSFAAGEAVPLGALLQAPTGPYGDWLWRSGLVEGAVL